MEAIRKWRKVYVLLLIVSGFFTVFFFRRFMVEMAIVFGCANIVLLILLIKQNQLLKDAELIWDNRLLAVPSVVITTENGQERSKEQTVVSVFGILMGNKIYKWGSNGVHGVRLVSVVIEKAYIRLTFGDNTKTMWVHLLHGLVNEQEVFELKEKLWRETGVTAKVSGW